MYFEAGPTTRAAIQPPSGMRTSLMPKPSTTGDFENARLITIFPFTMMSSRSIGAIDWTVTSTFLTESPVIASSEPGALPSTENCTNGPVVPNVRPDVMPASHDATDNGPSPFTYVPCGPGGGSRQTSGKLSVPPVAASRNPQLRSL